MNNFQFQQTDIFCVSGKFFVWKKKTLQKALQGTEVLFKENMGGNIFALRFSACIYILIRVRPWNFTKCNSLVVSYRDCMLILFRYVNFTYLFSDGSDARNPSFMFLLVFGSFAEQSFTDSGYNHQHENILTQAVHPNHLRTEYLIF